MYVVKIHSTEILKTIEGIFLNFFRMNKFLICFPVLKDLLIWGILHLQGRTVGIGSKQAS
jgi:hypothetical protein